MAADRFEIARTSIIRELRDRNGSLRSALAASSALSFSAASHIMPARTGRGCVEVGGSGVTITFPNPCGAACPFYLELARRVCITLRRRTKHLEKRTWLGSAETPGPYRSAKTRRPQRALWRQDSYEPCEARPTQASPSSWWRKLNTSSARSTRPAAPISVERISSKV